MGPEFLWKGQKACNEMWTTNSKMMQFLKNIFSKLISIEKLKFNFNMRTILLGAFLLRLLVIVKRRFTCWLLDSPICVCSTQFRRRPVRRSFCKDRFDRAPACISWRQHCQPFLRQCKIFALEEFLTLQFNLAVSNFFKFHAVLIYQKSIYGRRKARYTKWKTQKEKLKIRLCRPICVVTFRVKCSVWK